MWFISPSGSEGAGQWWQLKPGTLQMEGGDGSAIASLDFSNGKKMTCCLLANQQ